MLPSKYACVTTQLHARLRDHSNACVRTIALVLTCHNSSPQPFIPHFSSSVYQYRPHVCVSAAAAHACLAGSTKTCGSSCDCRNQQSCESSGKGCKWCGSLGKCTAVAECPPGVRNDPCCQYCCPDPTTGQYIPPDVGSPCTAYTCADTQYGPTQIYSSSVIGEIYGTCDTITSLV